MFAEKYLRALCDLVSNPCVWKCYETAGKPTVQTSWQDCSSASSQTITILLLLARIREKALSAHRSGSPLPWFLLKWCHLWIYLTFRSFKSDPTSQPFAKNKEPANCGRPWDHCWIPYYSHWPQIQKTCPTTFVLSESYPINLPGKCLMIKSDLSVIPSAKGKRAIRLVNEKLAC